MKSPMKTFHYKPEAKLAASADWARFGWRFSAIVFDGLLLMFVLIFGADFLPGRGFGIMALIAVAGLLSLIEGFTGWTLGKLVLGLRIRNEDGTKASRSTLLGRWALKNIGYLFGSLAVLTKVSMFTFFGLLGALVIVLGGLFTRRAKGLMRQTLHDKLLHTAVFKASFRSRVPEGA